MIKKLVSIILNYESDTFSASSMQVNRFEATAIAHMLMARLLDIATEGGTLICDGVVMFNMLMIIRDKSK